MTARQPEIPIQSRMTAATTNAASASPITLAPESTYHPFSLIAVATRDLNVVNRFAFSVRLLLDLLSELAQPLAVGVDDGVDHVRDRLLEPGELDVLVAGGEQKVGDALVPEPAPRLLLGRDGRDLYRPRRIRSNSVAVNSGEPADVP